jgi:hypothetical protein
MAGTPSSPVRQPIAGFARFFRGYALSLSIIVASVPLVSGYFDLMPFFLGTKAFLTGLTSLGSYLLVGFLFFQRLSLATLYFPLRRIGDQRVAFEEERRRIRGFGFVPLYLILIALFLFPSYILVTTQAEREVAYGYGVLKDGRPLDAVTVADLPKPPEQEARLSLLKDNSTFEIIFRVGSNNMPFWDVQFPNQEIVKGILAQTPYTEQPRLLTSTLLFLFAFLFVVAAFILVGLRDYLQAELGVSDTDLLGVDPTEKERFWVDDLPGIYGYIEYSFVVPEVRPRISGPFCLWHDLLPEPTDVDPVSGQALGWRHKKPLETPNEIPCTFKKVDLSPGAFFERFQIAAQATTMRIQIRIAPVKPDSVGG